MTRARGRCDRGKRLLSKATFGHWKTQTFVARLRGGDVTAPRVVGAPMDWDELRPLRAHPTRPDP